MQNYYQFMIPRLNGETIRQDFTRYRSLVRKGVAGFIIFGGDLETVREYVRRLQAEAELPLIISSDLERGLGQQLRGGTLFPPAMAMGEAFKKLSVFSDQLSAKGKNLSALRMIRRSFKAVAIEAKYAGINTIFAPVLDINTNPKNPIIAVRAFGEEPETVSLLGAEMIRVLQKNGIAACGKHFPGHGDTSVDSHIRLPVLHQEMKRLRRYELKPFEAAMDARVRMIMLGHLSVPALDASGTPVSFSKKAVQFLRREMGYDGLLVTDALNMGGIGKFSEEEASYMALEAGVDILLHPSDAEKVAAHLEKMKACPDPARLIKFRKRLKPLEVAHKPPFEGRLHWTGEHNAPFPLLPQEGVYSSPEDKGRRGGVMILPRFTEGEVVPFESHARISEQLTEEAITMSSSVSLRGTPLLVILNDDGYDKGICFADCLKKQFPEMRIFRLKPGINCPSTQTPPLRGGDKGEGGVCGLADGRLSKSFKKRQDEFLIVAIFSETKAWKGGASSWLRRKIELFSKSADLFISFGSPYLLQDAGKSGRMSVFWDAEQAQQAAAEKIIKQA